MSEDRQRDAEHEQRKKKLVEVFSFSQDNTAKYGCENYMLPLAKVIKAFGSSRLYPSLNFANEFIVDDSVQSVDIDWRKTKAITLRDGNLITVILW